VVALVTAFLLVTIAQAAPVDPAVVEAALAAAEPLRSRRMLGGLPAIPASAYAQVAAGGAAVTGVQDTGGPLKRVWGVGVLDAPAGALAAAISDDERKPQFTDLTKAVVLSGAPCADGRVVLQYLDVSLLSDRWWVVTQRVNKALAAESGGKVRELSWTAVSDAPARLTPELAAFVDGAVQVPATEGAWFLVDLGDGRTLVEYVQSTDPGGSVPAGLAASMAGRSIPDTFAAMQKMAKSPGACSAD
jgi:hypothetical protein